MDSIPYSIRYKIPYYSHCCSNYPSFGQCGALNRLPPLCPCDKLSPIFSTSLLSGTTRCSKHIFGFSPSQHRISHFSTELWFPYWQKIFRSVMASRPSQQTEIRNVYTYILKHIYFLIHIYVKNILSILKLQILTPQTSISPFSLISNSLTMEKPNSFTLSP